MCPGRPSRRWRSPAMTPMRTMVATTTVIDLARNRPYSSSASKGNSSRSCGAPMVTHWHRPGKTVAGPESGGGPPGETQGGQAVLGQSEGDVIDFAGCRQLFQTMIEADQGIGENFQLLVRRLPRRHPLLLVVGDDLDTALHHLGNL